MSACSFSSRLLSSSLLACTLVAITSSAAAAEGSSGPKLRSSLSQLEFDEGFVPAHKTTPPASAPAPAPTEKIQLIPGPVVIPAVIKQSTAPQTNQGSLTSASLSKKTTKQIAKQQKAAKGAEARAMLSINPSSEQKLENQIIVPRLRGPFTDKGDSKRIKSALSWKPKKKTACSLPLDGNEMCNKARALKETLFRFSGNHDFFDSQCAQSCTKPGETSVPQGLNIPDSSDTSFRLVSEDGACHYELGKKNESNWMVMSPSKVSCVCLPTDCFNN